MVGPKFVFDVFAQVLPYICFLNFGPQILISVPIFRFRSLFSNFGPQISVPHDFGPKFRSLHDFGPNFGPCFLHDFGPTISVFAPAFHIESGLHFGSSSFLVSVLPSVLICPPRPSHNPTPSPPRIRPHRSNLFSTSPPPLNHTHPHRTTIV